MKTKSQSITIRKAMPADVPAFVEMWEEFSREHERMVVQKTKPFREFYVRRDDVSERVERYFRKNIRSRNWGVFIGEADGRPAGYMTVTIQKNPPVYEIDRIGHIDDIYIRKLYRGAGLSSRFKDLAIDWFRRKGLSYMSLRVAPENSHARRIYSNWGFLDFQAEMRMKL
jgi:GNAT superfamily N-acetyltransferase